MNKDFLMRISAAQTELKAPKNQYNSFGKYSYRSCEDILEAAKPVCAKYGLLLTVSDEAVQIGERYYIKATAALYDAQGGSDEVMSATAYAREPESKKGMDDSQITGTASSYARKYALNGLFNIDDTKDADTDEYRKNSQKAETAKAESPIMCPKCGKEVKSQKKRDGTIASAKAVFEGCGGMCYKCYEKEKEGK